MERVNRILEYDKMKKQLYLHASSSLGQQRIRELSPHYKLTEIEELQKETYEGAKILRLKGHAPLGGLKDIREAVKRAKIGGLLQAAELLEIASTIYSGRRFNTFIEKMVEEEVELSIFPALLSEVYIPRELEEEIEGAIDDNGKVLDSASSKLRTLRQQIRSFESAVRSKLESITRSSGTQKMLSDSIVTIRNERYVIPVKSEYRANFGGMVHDQSASGATLFIEPESVVQINNQLREVTVQEKLEIDRILAELSASVTEHTISLEMLVDVMAKVDFIFAKARYSDQIKGIKPKLNDEGKIMMKKARHPLIADDEIVPIDIELGENFSSLIITGPNTGGKTVTLKTVGLLTLMAQSGLHIPCEEESSAAVFQKIFADIGDEQSIEQSLSTFSSHMTNIVNIINTVDFQSLVLFDELGAGTDPTEGAALAISILDHVYDVGAKVIATTHYSELKSYAYDREGVMNASVEFNVETLRPTYRLLIGVPGRSNAFAISRRLGLKEKIIDEAKAQLSSETNQLESMISSLEENRKKAEEERHLTKKNYQDSRILLEDLTSAFQELQLRKEEILEKAREDALHAVKKSKVEAEEIIQYLREMQKTNDSIKEHELIDAKKHLESTLLPLEEMKKTKKGSNFKKKGQELLPGDEVKVLTFNQKGYIVDKINDSEFNVQLGVMKMKVKKENLLYIDRPKPIETRPMAAVRGRNSHVKTELDLRGERYESAMLDVEKYLDDAVLAGYHQVSIIHGKGTGALRKGVQELLRNHKSVESTRLGTQGEGGNGVTIVHLQ